MQTRHFDYHLPEHLIARTPALRRDHSRLMVIERATGKVTHSEFAKLPEFLPQGARLFRNNATVLRARLKAQRHSGGQVECLLLRPAKTEDLAFFAATQNTSGNLPKVDTTVISPWDFICLLKPGRRLKPGEMFYREGHFTATVLDKHPDGENRVRFTPLRGQQSVVEIAALAGDLPLPPYIEQARIADAKARATDGGGGHLSSIEDAVPHAGKGSDSNRHADSVHNGHAGGSNTDSGNNSHSHPGNDNERYQTVYADPARTVAAAAPTAGLHFTPELLTRLTGQGIGAHDLTLHVGLDTFRPITTDTIEAHQIHRELYEIPPETLRALEPLPDRPRVAVGTTTLRSIEHYFRHRVATATEGSAIATETSAAVAVEGSAAAEATLPFNAPWVAEADIFIYPPAQFIGVEALITNFHLPKSTLLCLVSAFLTPGSTDGIARLKELYAEAIAHNYRFYSYGDAMLIL